MGSEEPVEQSIMRHRVGKADAVKSYLRTHRPSSPRGEPLGSGLRPVEAHQFTAVVTGGVPQLNSVPSTHMR